MESLVVDSSGVQDSGIRYGRKVASVQRGELSQPPSRSRGGDFPERDFNDGLLVAPKAARRSESARVVP